MREVLPHVASINERDSYFIVDGKRAAIYIGEKAYVKEYLGFIGFAKAYLQENGLLIEIANATKTPGLFTRALFIYLNQ